jgi:type IV secretion system protein VirB4
MEGFFENEWCDKLDKAYQSKMSQKRMFINEQYLTIVRRPQQGAIGLLAEIARSLFNKMDKKIKLAQEEDAHKALNEAISNILTTLAPYRPALLGIEETDRGLFSQPLSFFSYLLNFEKVDVRLPNMPLFSSAVSFQT